MTYTLGEVPAMLRYWARNGEKTFEEPDIAYYQAGLLMNMVASTPHVAQLGHARLQQDFINRLKEQENKRKIRKDSVFTNSPIPLRKLQWSVGTDHNFWFKPQFAKIRFFEALAGHGEVDNALISAAYSPDTKAVTSLDAVFLKINPRGQDEIILQVLTLPNYSGGDVVNESFLPVAIQGSVFINNLSSYRVSADSKTIVFEHEDDRQEFHSAGNMNGRQIFFSSKYEKFSMK